MKINRLVSIGSALLLSMSSLLAFVPTQSVSAASIAWTGAASDYKIGTGANWSGGVAPGAGDILNFTSWVGPGNNNSTNTISLVNDLPGTVFGGITTGGTGTAGEYYNIDTVRVEANAVVSGSAAISLAIDNLLSTGIVTLDHAVAQVAVVGNLIAQNGAAAYDLTATTMTVKSDSYVIGQITPTSYSYKNVGEIVIEKGAQLYLCGSTGVANITSNITFGGGTGTTTPEILLQPCMGAEGVTFSSAGAEFTGTITLLSDAKLSASNKKFVVKGALVSNGHDLSITADGASKIMGNGTIGSLSLATGSIIAPGLSPGCLNTGNLTMLSGSSYDFELGGAVVCTEYDQIKVTGAVDLGNGTLNTILYNGFKPVVGQSFTIIDNDGADAVAGTFLNLPEGATFTVDGYVLKISYVGGDGNDVVLTAQSVPTTPDTGFALITSNPIATLIATVLAAGGILAINRHFQKVANKR